MNKTVLRITLSKDFERFWSQNFIFLVYDSFKKKIQNNKVHAFIEVKRETFVIIQNQLLVN